TPSPAHVDFSCRTLLGAGARSFDFPPVRCDRSQDDKPCPRDCRQARQVSKKQVAEQHTPSERDVMNWRKPCGLRPGKCERQEKMAGDSEQADQCEKSEIL